MRISVVLCSCNGARFIGEQVSSICAQTLPATELLIQDDVSEDETLDEARKAWLHCREMGMKVPRLTIKSNPLRLGVAANFSKALASVSCDLIALADQDDVWHEQRLQIAVEAMQSRPSRLLVHSDANMVDAQRRLLKHSLFDALSLTTIERDRAFSGDELPLLLDRNLVTGATTLIRRPLLDLALPVPAFWLHDEWLGVIAAALGEALAIPERLIDYRQHAANQVGAKRESVRAMLRRLLEPRGDFHLHRFRRAQELQRRLRMAGSQVNEEAHRLVEEKVAHHAVRAAYPSSRWMRAPQIVGEWRTGRYRRFGRGLRGLLKDLVESA